MTEEEMKKKMKEKIFRGIVKKLKDEIAEKDKQIVELKKELALKENINDYQCELSDNSFERVKELETQNNNLQIMLQAEREVRCNEDYLKKVTELEAQIEKMKRCEICKHHRWNHCSYEINITEDCIQNKLKHFELKE